MQQTEYVAHKAWNTYFLAVYRKGLLFPDLCNLDEF